MSGEEEMRRLSATLRKFTEGRAHDKLNNWKFDQRDVVIAELQERFDHLAGVRPHGGVE